MGRQKIISVGLDFDGVVAYNPFRIIRAPVKLFKRKVLGINKLTFFVPKNAWQTWLWKLVHESSIFPAKGCELLKELGKDKRVRFYLITGRYGCLEEGLIRWLKRNQLDKVFYKIHVNVDEEQPHLFKKRIISSLKMDYFIEDNLDIVNYLRYEKTTKVWWIYNVLDKNKVLSHKFPYLEKALLKLAEDENII